MTQMGRTVMTPCVQGYADGCETTEYQQWKMRPAVPFSPCLCLSLLGGHKVRPRMMWEGSQ